MMMQPRKAQNNSDNPILGYKYNDNALFTKKKTWTKLADDTDNRQVK